MVFVKRLEKFFVLAMVLAVSVLAYNFLQAKRFKENDLSAQTTEKIAQRSAEVLQRIHHYYGPQVSIPLQVSDEFHSNLYGLTVYKGEQVAIYLNKKRFKESEAYMIEEVIPHEYAHAMVMLLGKRDQEGDGHTPLWQAICFKLGGKSCVRYVDNEEIVRQKMGF
jgi:SprT protein